MVWGFEPDKTAITMNPELHHQNRQERPEISHSYDLDCSMQPRKEYKSARNRVWEREICQYFSSMRVLCLFLHQKHLAVWNCPVVGVTKGECNHDRPWLRPEKMKTAFFLWCTWEVSFTRLCESKKFYQNYLRTEHKDVKLLYICTCIVWIMDFDGKRLSFCTCWKIILVFLTTLCLSYAFLETPCLWYASTPSQDNQDSP